MPQQNNKVALYYHPVVIGTATALAILGSSVGDADNFRFYHTPLLHLQPIPTKRSDLKDQTLHIRLAGVDAPELAHFGNPAQPYSAEALDWLTKTLLHKYVLIEPLRKDRYGRVVAMVYIRQFLFYKNVSEEMLKAGLATVYTQAGAEYKGLLSSFEQCEKEAKAAKKGMWGLKKSSYESPAEYKKRIKGGNTDLFDNTSAHVTANHTGGTTATSKKNTAKSDNSWSSWWASSKKTPSKEDSKSIKWF